MAPINESNVKCNGTEQENSAAPANEPHKFTFPSHQFHILNLAKMCKENKEYTDVVIHVGESEEELRAHRLVLGSVSPFLKLVFGDIPSTLPEATILVPGVKKRVVKALLDFFYTGQMTVERADTSDLQLLIDTLKIDPGLITVDALQPTEDHEGPSASTSKEEAKEEEKTTERPATTACQNTKDESIKRKRSLEADETEVVAHKKSANTSHEK